ncbi:type III pantothenate kinase [Chitinimonas naiadis]
MSTLLLDAGNSRLKWRLCQEALLLGDGVAGYDDLAGLALALRQHAPITKVLACNVAGAGVAQQLTDLLTPLPVDWLKPDVHLAGLRNHYRIPGQLGADRWAAMLGARSLVNEDCIVVMAGTAMTVDALTSDGDFLGGIIVPGFRLMRTALAQGTADLGLPEGAPVDFPHSTGEAIVNGALLALCGAIHEMRKRLQQQRAGMVPVLLSGGDATLLAPLLAPTLAAQLMPVDNLVLRGLARLAFPDASLKEY